jgi:carboxyl-terminal processing protease
MNRSRVTFFLLSSLLVLPMLMGTLLLAADHGRRADAPGRDGRAGKGGKEAAKEDDSFDTYYKYLGVFSEVLGLIRQSYVDEPNTDSLMAGALEGVSDALDPFSVYVPASAVPGYLQAQSVGKQRSGVVLLKVRGRVFVVAVEKGSPAGRAGVRAGELVAKLADRPTRTMPLWEMQEILAGPPGTKVVMEVIRPDQATPSQVSFELKSFAPPPVSLEEVEGAPLLRIPSFDAGTAGQVREALKTSLPRLRGAARAQGKLLVDLRGVSSGDGEAAYATAKLFASGDLGALKRRKDEVKTYTASEPPVWQGRIVVLVDRGTSGAAEILATVLRQRVKAELVGDWTLGHAGHQAAADLSSGGRLFYTDAFYTGPDKKPLNEALKPDLLVSERTRTLLEKDVPLEDLILKRGVRHLLEEPEAAKKAA